MPGGGEAPVDDHEHVLGQALHLLEDVRGKEDGVTRGGTSPEHLHQLESLSRIGAVEGLVEDQDLRVVDQGGGYLRPLPHPLRVASHGPVLRILQLDEGHRAASGLRGVGETVQSRARECELTRAEEGIDRLPLRYQANAPVEIRVAPRGLAVDLDGSRRGAQEAGDHVQQRALARSIGAEQSGDAGPDGERDVVDGDDVAVPARDAAHLDRSRLRRHQIDPRKRRTTIAEASAAHVKEARGQIQPGKSAQATWRLGSASLAPSPTAGSALKR